MSSPFFSPQFRRPANPHLLLMALLGPQEPCFREERRDAFFDLSL
jgi:hypothetical protein